jgi:uncharacterized membrane protein YkoI
MKLKRTSLIACLVSSFLMAGGLFAAQAQEQPQEKPMPDAAAPAKGGPIGMEKARVIALEKVPGGEVATEELKRGNDILVYAFDILIKGKKGAQEVIVAATTGEVLSVKYKSPSTMKREAKAKRTRNP